MHRIFRVKAYEMEHGPHFNEEHARKAVMKMENEDGTRGPHWSLEETSALASQYGISLSGKFNRYDWFVALNMVYSDYYKVLLNITGSNNIKHYNENSKIVELQNEINELKNIIRKANQMVPPPMKDMLPQDMKDAMNKVDQ